MTISSYNNQFFSFYSSLKWSCIIYLVLPLHIYNFLLVSWKPHFLNIYLSSPFVNYWRLVKTLNFYHVNFICRSVSHHNFNFWILNVYILQQFEMDVDYFCICLVILSLIVISVLLRIIGNLKFVSLTLHRQLYKFWKSHRTMANFVPFTLV